MSVRVYVPLTSAGLAELVDQGRLTGPRTAHAVTDALRAAWPDTDEESWEYAAMLAAGEESWQLRTDQDRPRRLVLAADVPEVSVGGEELTAVRLSADIPLKRVASVHLDTEDVVGEPDFDEDLAWFAVQEIAHLR